MVNRRSVMKVGAAAVAGALVNVPVSGRNATATFPDAQRIKEQKGVITSAIRGDVAKLWYDDLRVQLSKDPAPIAGLTDRATLFCLEELARDVGMRVIFRVDHIIDRSKQDRHAQHTAVGPASLVAADHHVDAGTGFGQAMAPAVQAVRGRVEPGDLAAQKRTGPFSPENKTALVSWWAVRNYMRNKN